MCYFILPRFVFNLYNKNNYLFFKKIWGLNAPTVGDVFTISFQTKGWIYFFEGLCFRIKKKKFIDPNSSLSLYNVLDNISVELIVSFFYNRIFFLRNNKFKRKQFNYSKAKLYFLLKDFKSLSYI